MELWIRSQDREKLCKVHDLCIRENQNENNQTNYERKGNLLPTESVEPMLEDLMIEIERLKEKVEDLEEDIEEEKKHYNYRRDYE